MLLEIHRGEPERAGRGHEGVARCAAKEGENLLYNAEVLWLAVRVEAELGERARVSGDAGAFQECDRIAAAALAVIDGAVSALIGDPHRRRLRSGRSPKPSWRGCGASDPSGRG